MDGSGGGVAVLPLMAGRQLRRLSVQRLRLLALLASLTTLSMISIVVLPLMFRGSTSPPAVADREAAEVLGADSHRDDAKVRNATLAVPLG